tara:strand:+ start:886 stop:1113 length:228 start_codon:yes stop_codon:yes gene_type:complete
MNDLLKCVSHNVYTIRLSVANAILKAERLDWDDLAVDIIDTLALGIAELAHERDRYMDVDTANDLATNTFDRYAL